MVVYLIKELVVTFPAYHLTKPLVRHHFVEHRGGHVIDIGIVADDDVHLTGSGVIPSIGIATPRLLLRVGVRDALGIFDDVDVRVQLLCKLLSRVAHRFAAPLAMTAIIIRLLRQPSVAILGIQFV